MRTMSMIFFTSRNPIDSPNARLRPDVAAFSTIEVLVSVLISAIVFVSLYSGLSSGFGFVQATRENLRATQILVERMETLRLYRWDQINQQGFVPTEFVEEFYPAATQSTSGLCYTGSVSISAAPISEFYGDALKQVTVGLTWKSGAAVRKRQMITFVSEYGLQNYIYGR